MLDKESTHTDRKAYFCIFKATICSGSARTLNLLDDVRLSDLQCNTRVSGKWPSESLLSPLPSWLSLYGCVTLPNRHISAYLEHLVTFKPPGCEETKGNHDKGNNPLRTVNPGEFPKESKRGFFTHSTVDIWGQITLCCEQSYAPWDIKQQPWPLPLMSIAFPSELRQPKMCLDIAECPLQGPDWSIQPHWPKTLHFNLEYTKHHDSV